MRLFELGKLPTKAGVAMLHWGKGYDDPKRDGKDINISLLDRADDVQFLPLLGGQQFLVDYYSERLEERKVFFGGTDESPFLVRLLNDVLKGLRGEKDFFDRLRPQTVKDLEKHFGVEAIRQGDWFAVPLPMTWKQVFGAMSIFSNSSSDNKDVLKTGAGGISIGGTRHRLVGQYIPATSLVEGVLSAPDHKDCDLKGPHVLYQTQWLADPKNAD